ncbi:cardiolipin synthase [Ulvibacter antarcticus]|uniref:Cardiolipin synthase n=1 Tax=Ulvibacter antarcticus TaxID=442714 RepID=A0A3L9Z6M6_9FLAO|nr:cardiolipin synthase [Ulvibacter antarcticus]RMA66058.1 cardiolipin synthase [Ulvibacter antarcticus]
MNWIFIAQVVYFIIVILTGIRIIFDTHNKTKTLAYLLIVIFLPIVGILLYFSFGINYRKRKIYDKKLIVNELLEQEIEDRIKLSSSKILDNGNKAVRENKKLINFLINECLSPLTENNSVKILVNGESKFPKVFEILETAKNHIHIEYYIFNDDEIGREFIEILIKKAKEGVKVRFMYDDFGSRNIRKKQLPRMREAGVDIFPFYEIKLYAFANRINYRNHRKIIVIDGVSAFVGGINVSDNYVNKDGKELYWRDTHLELKGPVVSYLQYIFITDWNYCAAAKLEPNEAYFPKFDTHITQENKVAQIAASGPDSDHPHIEFSLIQAIHLAQEEILITTPYFIPGENLMDALIIAAGSGINIKLLVPGVSDSRLVNNAARSYYGPLLKAGVEIYLYQKGFIHAKTMVTDRQLSIVGTANMDIRSFDLNFEVNALIYDEEIGKELSEIFYEDLKFAEQIDFEAWKNRPMYVKLIEKTIGLLSPML